MGLSVIIPTLNEEKRIDVCLEATLGMGGIDECIVVDGGSRDETIARAAKHHGVRVISAARGRGQQCNAGAMQATHSTLLFLHADVTLPPHAAATISSTLAQPGTVAGAFRTWHVADHWRGKRRALLLHLADFRSRYARTPYGDQAMFMSREVFFRVGGFPDIPLMEDIVLGERLRQLGSISICTAHVEVSGRRFERSPILQTLAVNLFPVLFRFGVSPELLALLYRTPR